MAQTGTGFLPFDKCQKLVERACDLVINYAKNIEKQYKITTFTQPIIELDTVKQRILKANNRFLTDAEIEGAIKPILLAFFSWNSKLSNQLTQFWKAQLDLANTAVGNTTNPTYDPLKLANQKLPEILKADEIYQKVVTSINSNPNEDSLIYAVFYNFITLVESAEYAFRQDFGDLLNLYGLDSKYDASEIFSVDGKVSMNTKFRTDGRAVRDALGHFKFEIQNSGNNMVIKFKNNEKGYNFVKTFKKIEFLEFVQNTYLLYKTHSFLVWLFIASATMNSAFKK